MQICSPLIQINNGRTPGNMKFEASKKALFKEESPLAVDLDVVFGPALCIGLEWKLEGSDGTGGSTLGQAGIAVMAAGGSAGSCGIKIIDGPPVSVLYGCRSVIDGFSSIAGGLTIWMVAWEKAWLSNSCSIYRHSSSSESRHTNAICPVGSRWRYPESCAGGLVPDNDCGTSSVSFLGAWELCCGSIGGYLRPSRVLDVLLYRYVDVRPE